MDDNEQQKKAFTPKTSKVEITLKSIVLHLLNDTSGGCNCNVSKANATVALKAEQLGFTRHTLSLTLSQTHNKHDSNALPIY
jgi:hypothetical protein